MAALRAAWAGSRWVGRVARGAFERRVGGPARARVIALFGAVLALSAADASTVSAVAPQLESALGIGATKLGLLISASLVVGAVFTIPVGVVVDRAKRMPILAISIVLWSIASLASAFAGSYGSLVLTRLALGAVTAAAGPAIASLTGDYFPAGERGRIYAYILAGEVAGSAVGYIISGSVASLLHWRAAFVVLAIPGFFLAWTLWRAVPEPRRGGLSRLEPGAKDIAMDRAGEAGPTETVDAEATRASWRSGCCS
jgi:MFS family permease